MMRAAALALLAACAAPRAAPPEPARPRGVLLVRSTVPEASLWIDEQLVGEVGRLAAGVQLSAGEHLVELRHDGYHTRYAEVSIAPGERKLLELTLPEALP